MIAAMFIDQGYPICKVLRFAGLSVSSYYYRSRPGRSGNKPSRYTGTLQGTVVANEQVISQIKHLLEHPWVDYGYIKVTWWLRRNHDYIISFKKVYRLMRENRLLLPSRRVRGNTNGRRWADWDGPEVIEALSYWQFDIKYIWIAGCRSNALLLTVLDVKSRYVLGHHLAWNIRKEQVRETFAGILRHWRLPEVITARSDNGSQFISAMVREYLQQMNIVQEFTRPATPQQNGHVEAWHSIVERSICQRIELENLTHSRGVIANFIDFYNNDRIHSGIDYKSPRQYLLDMGIDLTMLELDPVIKPKP